MKILHTGDMHLDSPFSTLRVGGNAAKAELRAVFSDIISYAINEKADMLLIAGDLFDSGFATRETAQLIISELTRLSVPCVIAPGNHDPYTDASIWAKKDFPDNVYIFKSSELSYFDFEELNTRVYGYAFTSASLKKCPFSGRSVEDSSRINILLAHTDISSALSVYCPSSPLEIKAFGADYSALGHIHSPSEANNVLSEKEACALYSGAPQGRDFGECGEKGAVLLEITKTASGASVKTELVPFSRSRFEDITLDITGSESISDIKSEIRALIAREGLGSDTHLRIHLAGNISPEIVIEASELENSLSEGLLSLTLVDESVPLLLIDELKYDKGIRGEVYRVLSDKINGGDAAEKEAALDALRLALQSLSGEDIK